VGSGVSGGGVGGGGKRRLIHAHKPRSETISCKGQAAEHLDARADAAHGGGLVRRGAARERRGDELAQRQRVRGARLVLGGGVGEGACCDGEEVGGVGVAEELAE